jgi:Schlafen, AlbA_2
MINKPIDQITAEDIGALCLNGGAYEGLTLEFKRELSRKNNRPDPWMAGGEFTAHARDALFREIVAFANAQGGTLVLGICETADNPARAAAVWPIPRTHDLAARLEDAARACIEPPLGLLHVRGIVTDGADGGVVLFRTAASPLGPHRVMSDGHSFIRRGPSSVKMTMREIQDLTIDLARGADRLDRFFKDRAAEFAKWFRLPFANDAERGGLRVTAVPIGSLPQRVRVADDPGQFSLERAFPARLDQAQEVPLELPIKDFRTRPILRGERLYSDAMPLPFQLEILDQGIVDFWLDHSVWHGVHFNMGWVLGATLAVLRIADRLRGLGAAPEWEFGIELELDSAPPGAGMGRSLPNIMMGTLGSGAIQLDAPPLTLPRLQYRSRADEEIIVNAVLRDLLDASGQRRHAHLTLL